MRQLKQRIGVRTQLAALDAEETKRYIEQRLQIAGEEPHSIPLFPEETIEVVHHYSRGLPRLINTICENALIAAYARRLPNVTPEIIDYVAKEFRLVMVSPPESEKAERYDQIDPQRAMRALLDLFATLEDKSQTIQTQTRLSSLS